MLVIEVFTRGCEPRHRPSPKLAVLKAAVICSVAADLTISQAANDPNYLVTAMLPLRIFEGASRQSRR
jgi:acetamidase/formamidase